MSADEPVNDDVPNVAADNCRPGSSGVLSPDGVRRTPHQLPARLPHFVGRVDLVARANDVLTGDPTAPTALVMLTGAPGSGATSAALQLASLRPGPFPGGELFVDLRARTAHDGLRACVRSYGVPEDEIPDSVPELNVLYRRCTAGSATLVVLDNVTEPAQVYPFLPTGSGSVVIATSSDELRELVTWVGAVSLPVPPLEAEHGRTMLGRLCGAARLDADPDASGALVRLCGGLPVPLATAGRWLAEKPSRSVGELVAAVTARATGSVSALFSVVCHDLSAQDALLYQRLSMLPVVDFGERLALEATATAGSLDRLAALALLVEEDHGRFRFPSLVARHAEEQAVASEPASERTAIARRAIQYFLRRTALAEQRMLGPTRPRFTPAPEPLDEPWDGLDPVAWLKAERLNLLEIVRAAYQCGWHEEAWQLAESLTALHWDKRHRADWVTASEVGARAANRVGNRQVEARLRAFTSQALLDLGFVDRAGRELDAALPLVQECGDQRLLASVWTMIGQVRSQTG